MYNLETELLAIKIARLPNNEEIIQKYEELYKLLVTYKTYNDSYLDNYFTNIEERPERLTKTCDALLDIVDFINKNRDILYPIRSLEGFKTIDMILTNWKYISKEHEFIMYLRKCINWIRRKY
jgi:hypothetical protein